MMWHFWDNDWLGGMRKGRSLYASQACFVAAFFCFFRFFCFLLFDRVALSLYVIVRASYHYFFHSRLPQNGLIHFRASLHLLLPIALP